METTCPPCSFDPGLSIPRHVGTRSIFEAAGFVEVHRATLRRVVMRIDF